MVDDKNLIIGIVLVIGVVLVLGGFIPGLQSFKSSWWYERGYIASGSVGSRICGSADPIEQIKMNPPNPIEWGLGFFCKSAECRELPIGVDTDATDGLLIRFYTTENGVNWGLPVQIKSNGEIVGKFMMGDYVQCYTVVRQGYSGSRPYELTWYLNMKDVGIPKGKIEVDLLSNYVGCGNSGATLPCDLHIGEFFYLGEIPEPSVFSPRPLTDFSPNIKVEVGKLFGLQSLFSVVGKGELKKGEVGTFNAEEQIVYDGNYGDGNFTQQYGAWIVADKNGVIIDNGDWEVLPDGILSKEFLTRFNEAGDYVLAVVIQQQFLEFTGTVWVLTGEQFVFDSNPLKVSVSEDQVVPVPDEVVPVPDEVVPVPDSGGVADVAVTDASTDLTPKITEVKPEDIPEQKLFKPSLIGAIIIGLFIIGLFIFSKRR